MGLNSSKIVLITSGQPALNPRLVKEADLLAEAGYEVIVIYQHWNDWATEVEKTLLPQKQWEAIQVGGSPKNQAILYWYTRIRFKIARLLYKYFKLLPDEAIARSTTLLLSHAKKHVADLYIAHNLGALSAAVKAAQAHHAKCGFDAEDFHRYENADNQNHPIVKLNTLIENTYIPQIDYLTASSPLTSAAYSQIFNRGCPVILNVLPKTKNKQFFSNNAILRIFWFSQTIGDNRGIETIIEALNISDNKFELHLLGSVDLQYAETLKNQLAINKSQIHFHSPITPEKLPAFASQFDIGIASETGFSRNNKYALSNKIFTYIQTGLVTIASDTPAQKELLTKYPNIGSLYRIGNASQLAAVLDQYQNDRNLLLVQKTAAFDLGQSALNWEVEGKKLLALIRSTFEV
jgi:glycosyltransferase involved in cell wall biosynthesis